MYPSFMYSSIQTHFLVSQVTNQLTNSEKSHRTF